MPTVKASAVQSLPSTDSIDNKVRARFDRAVMRYHTIRTELENLEAELAGLAGTADQPGIIWRTVEEHGAHMKDDLPRDSQLVGAGSKWQVVGSRTAKFVPQAVELIELAGQMDTLGRDTKAYTVLFDRFVQVLQSVDPDAKLTAKKVDAAILTCQGLAAGQAIKVKKDVDPAVWDALARNDKIAAACQVLRQDRESYGLKEWTVVDE